MRGEATMSRQEHNKGHVVMPDSWSGLCACRRRHEGQDISDEEQGDGVQSWFPAVFVQCDSYVVGARLRHQHDDGDREIIITSADETKLSKDLILQTRHALRFALACLPLSESNLRQSIQHEAVAVHQWHAVLVQILSLSNGDSKIRTSAARLLSNLITEHAENAMIIFSLVNPSPSEETISNRFAQAVAETHPSWPLLKSNWTDLLLASAKSGNREALGAIVATIHNGLVALPEDDRAHVSQSLAADTLFTSTLLRQILSARSIESHAAGVQESQADDATEWISVLLEQLSRLGYMPSMYASISSGACDDGKALPEHLVLLHCIHGAVEEFMVGSKESWHPLGGDVMDGIISTHMFLAQQAGAIRQRMLVEDQTRSMEPNEVELSKAALTIILEIIATSLGDDSSSALAKLRLKVGQETSLIQDTGVDLGTIVDMLSKKNEGLKSRELKISQEEQRWITTVVQILGNLCFRCKPNQDLLRVTPVPIADFLPPVDGDRTALHVLLSCTSFSYGCFTLREWAIVALRNVLEGNDDNQTLVEKLQAQQPQQNAELAKMGLKVDMDEHGKVKVVPLG